MHEALQRGGQARGRRVAGKTEAREKDSGAAGYEEARHNTYANTLHTQTVQEEQKEKKEKEKRRSKNGATMKAGLQPRGRPLGNHTSQGRDSPGAGI